MYYDVWYKDPCFRRIENFSNNCIPWDNSLSWISLSALFASFRSHKLIRQTILFCPLILWHVEYHLNTRHLKKSLLSYTYAYYLKIRITFTNLILKIYTETKWNTLPERQRKTTTQIIYFKTQIVIKQSMDDALCDDSFPFSFIWKLWDAWHVSLWQYTRKQYNFFASVVLFSSTLGETKVQQT